MKLALQSNDYSFIENRIAKENIGEHDGDNFHLCHEVDEQLKIWRERHVGCTILGVCYECPHPRFEGFYPVVYEDDEGNRFWTLWGIGTIKEYMEAGLLK